MIQAEALVEKFKQALADKWGYIWGTSGIKWTQAEQNKKVKYMVTNYGTTWQKNSEAKQNKYYTAAVYGEKWIGHNVADCSGLFCWAFRQLKGPDIAHGSNSIYNKWCSAKGVLTEGKKENRQALIPGTAVFTGTEKDRGHIGLYVGSGKVIEASNTQAGVITSNVTAGKWKWWGELKDVNYESEAVTPDPEPAPADKNSWPTLKRGSKGTYVKQLQQMLLDRGYKLPKYGVDGDFGAETEAAVKQFQKDWGLTADGIAGPETIKMLQSTPVKAKLYTVTIKGLTREQAQNLCKQYAGSGMKEE